jgi:hypothetical protein
MKKLSTLLLFAVSVFAISCNKGNDPQTQPYAVDNVDDINVRQGEDDSWDLTVRALGPVYETVSLSISGLPQGLTATMSAKEGKPTFNSTVVFTNVSALPGSYPCVLTASSPEAGKSTYEFTVKISAPIVCGLIRDFDASSTCDPDYILEISTLNPPIEDSINTVQIFNISNSGATFQAQVNCSNNTISIPTQAVTVGGNTYQITGSGTFNGNDVITMNYTLSINGIPQPTCTTTFTPRP